MPIFLQKNLISKTFLAAVLALFMFSSTQVSAQYLCKAGYTFSSLSGYLGLQFNNKSTTLGNADSTSYLWIFGDGTSSSEKNPVHTYAKSGNVQVCLVEVAFYAGHPVCDDSVCKTIFIGSFFPTFCDSISATFGYSGTGIEYTFNHGVSLFTGTYNMPGVLDSWNFGDGTSRGWAPTGETITNPGISVPHNFPVSSVSKTYTVCRYAYLPGSNCKIDTSCQQVTIPGGSAGPACDSLNAGFTYQVSGSSTVAVTSAHEPTGSYMYWTMGDGQTRTGSTLTYTYPTSTHSQVYTICHVVFLSNNYYCKPDTFCQQVTIPGTGVCNANFSHTLTPNTGTILFTNTSTPIDSIQSFTWTFGDGSSSTTSLSPTHTYTSSGSYRVCLSIKTYRGCQSDKCDTIKISLPCNLKADFALEIDTTGTVKFTDLSTGGANNWIWMFGDEQGTGFGSQSQSPTHTYAHSGTYTVCLTVYINNNTSCSSTKCDTIKVSVPACNVVANYTYSVGTNGSVTFTDKSTGGANIWYWNFSDGGTSTDESLTHVFTHSGKYAVCLRAGLLSNTACYSYKCDSITITLGAFPCDSLTAYYYPNGSGNSYTFTPAHNPAGYQQYWIFGDGTNTSGTSSVDHTYPSNASTVIYNACHIVWGPNNTCRPDTFCREITVPGGCNLDATFQYAVHSPEVSIYVTQFGTGLTSYWLFGDGTGSNTNSSSFAHYYPQSTDTVTYHVCHIINYSTNSNCKNDTFCTLIKVPGLGTCNARFTYTTGPNIGQVNFINTSTSSDSIISYSWVLGLNAPISTEKNPTYTYPAGTYGVCLGITTAKGCTSEWCDTITISHTTPPCDSLNSEFSFTNSGNVFVFTSGYNPAGYHEYWSFGDGTTSGSNSASPVTHTYSSSNATAVYHVCHYVYYPNSSCPTDTTCEQVVVPGTSGTCKANFSFVVGANGMVTFTDHSTGGPTHWTWSFGVNTSGSSQQSPTHTYTASGTYRVCLNITTANGCTSEFCDTVKINLSNPCNANAEFQFTVYPGYGVIFHPVQTAGVVYSNWNFGDGTTENVDSAVVVHGFPKKSIAVTYHVCHIIYFSTSPICGDTSCADVTVPGTTQSSCNANFIATSNHTGSITFTDLSTSSDIITSWSWSFGDGSSSSASSTTHAYNSFGKFKVCLTIETAGGCTSTFCDSVNVSSTTPCNLNADFQYTNTSGTTFKFTPVSNNASVGDIWSFGDGTSGGGFGLNPAHTYPQSSATHTYTVCHIVYLSGTICADTTCKEITVPGSSTSGTCHSNFNWTLSTSTGGLVVFTNTSTSSDPVTSWLWSFGDGTTSDLFAPTHTYAPGTYYACLKLTSVSGCISYHCDSIHIGQANNNCNAQFKWETTGCDTVKFVSTSTGGFSNYEWVFGDGSPSSNDASPTHVYDAGTWNVTLYVYNTQTNCFSTISHAITVQHCNTVNDTICGVVFSDNNSNGVMDSSETPYANIEIHVDNNVIHADSFGHYQIILAAGTHTVYVVVPAGCVATLPLVYNGSNATSSYYKINGSAGGTFCGYNFGINCNVDHICGKVFYDTNNNGVQDSSEAGLPNLSILITGANNVVHHAYTDGAGQYCETVPSGSYTITIGSTTYSACTTTPTSINVNATGNGQSYTGNDFAVYCPPGNGDFKIEISPNTTVTPGFPAWYSVQVCNIGASPMSGVASMFYDPSILTFDYSLPGQNASTGNSISWNITNLKPGACVYFWLSFNAVAPLTPGQPVFSEAIVTPSNGYTDSDPTNNIDTLHQEVKASWDPNSKEAYLTNYSNPAYQLVSSLNSNQKIEYTINFQNDGNANAINIVVDDNLSPDLDANSFQLISSSHPCTVSRNGNDVNFKFSNIGLPPSSVDEPNSHGYVKYSVNSINGLPAGHVISDPAAVYFDYNAPVMTGSADIIMLDITGVNEVKPATIVLGPNPMSNYTMVTLKGNIQGSFKFRVMDMTGRIVSEQLSNGNSLQFDRNNLAAGMYSYYVMQNNVVVNKGKLVIE